MTRPHRTLAARFLFLALVQIAILTAAAVTIWWFTVPEHGPRRFDRDPRPGDRRGPPPPDDGGPPGGLSVGPLLTLGVGVLVLAAGAILTARWLVRPIEALSRTAGALGAGELRAQSGLNRDDELGELARRIDAMGARLEDILARERELLANVAHELRTPLARIGVALDLAAEGDGDRARASLAEIAVDVGELEVIVDDILTALRYDVTGGASLPLRRERIAPGAIATAAAERLRARHPERPLVVQCPEVLPAIDVDPMLVRRVLDNLLDNAHKYTPDRAAPITLAVAAAGATVTFTVADRGVGIATGDLPNIYNPFFRADRSRNKETGGVGLGLTLAKRIVMAHGGTIAADSGTGRGTTLTVALPAA
ncbi:MAG: HAMP domain-containing histidine kinase [Kofleriaceae bacterium]|jgi:two-component system OmpR family sensor kinase|nr:HAMP domain-containing histidine kinase [Kofleriaceae bacterium]MBP9171365.1 HAMP domain-containing histidine kinase [Kofleriaceae bacterium]MBP9862820.1 HAMP domain-containing histidine kinase [Kofleriaceae bacterium]